MDPFMYVIVVSGCLLGLLAFRSLVALVVLAFVGLAAVVGVGVGMCLSVGCGYVARVVLDVDGAALGLPEDLRPLLMVGLPIGLLVLVVCMALCFGKERRPCSHRNPKGTV